MVEAGQSGHLYRDGLAGDNCFGLIIAERWNWRAASTSPRAPMLYGGVYLSAPNVHRGDSEGRTATGYHVA